jgi:hypothetical protein
MNTNDLEEINKFMDVNTIKSQYLYWISDPMKSNMKDYFTSHKSEFGVLYFRLMLKYPKSYINAFLCQNCGYWYPETTFTVFFSQVYQNSYGIRAEPLLPKSIKRFFEALGAGTLQNLPAVSVLFNAGFPIWVIFFSFLLFRLKKSKNFSLILVPVSACWLTLILSTPVYAEFRYIYSLYISAPVIFVIALSCKDGNLSIDKAKAEKTAIKKLLTNQAT